MAELLPPTAEDFLFSCFSGSLRRFRLTGCQGLLRLALLAAPQLSQQTIPVLQTDTDSSPSNSRVKFSPLSLISPAHQKIADPRHRKHLQFLAVGVTVDFPRLTIFVSGQEDSPSSSPPQSLLSSAAVSLSPRPSHKPAENHQPTVSTQRRPLAPLLDPKTGPGPGATLRRGTRRQPETRCSCPRRRLFGPGIGQIKA
ncbi:hypothetical protein BGZ61DRAFT_480503 [Ilyonectria robusta]|uniref:uncharacterized protein n=1 Tax=Ilyonectria robusta TaxID=1079257 RepID=UPI001E8DAEFC|nr:uncharacterized protein BGZ61DRAFT_480503 [Ilyonectria robusta]KAH8683458.1 hypothetical protein BGZ61DRAFT_480503 [Ilyonectria robusta]